MTSTTHAAFVELIRVVADDLFVALKLPQPGTEQLHFVDANADLTEPVAVERRADLLLVAEGERPAAALLGEVQLAWDADKLYSTPHYQMAARSRLRCPVHVFVVTNDAYVERRFGELQYIGGDTYWRPIVIGPSSVESLRAIAGAGGIAESPHVSVLLALLAANFDDGTLTERAWTALTGMDDTRASDYLQALWEALNKHAHTILERLMQQTTRRTEYTNPYTLRLLAEGERAALLKLAARLVDRATLETLEAIEDTEALSVAVERAVKGTA